MGVSQFVAGGALCFVLIMAYILQTRLAEVVAEREARLTNVPVVTHDLGPGTVITADDLVMLRIDATFVPSKAIREMDELVGRTVNERILAEEYLQAERLAPRTPNQGLNAIVPAGVRAVSVELRAWDPVVTFIEPTNYVDLLVTLPEETGREWQPAQTVTIVQAARVLAVDEETSKTAKGEEVRIPRVTLAIPLAFAEDVVHSLAIGRAKLSLRSDIDLHRQDTNGARSSDRLAAAGGMSVAEFRARFSEDDVSRWIEIVYGDHKTRERVVDPHLLRGIDGPTPE